MLKAAAILAAIVLGACVPGLAQAVPALPWIIGLLLLVSFCAMPRGASRPTPLHLRLILAAWALGGLACAALWSVDRDLALGALLCGAAPTATAAPRARARPATASATGFSSACSLDRRTISAPSEAAPMRASTWWKRSST